MSKTEEVKIQGGNAARRLLASMSYHTFLELLRLHAKALSINEFRDIIQQTNVFAVYSAELSTYKDLPYYNSLREVWIFAFASTLCEKIPTYLERITEIARKWP